MTRAGPHIRARHLALVALSLVAALAAAPAAWAARAVTLKAEVSSGPSVTLGDLFEGAGSSGSVIVGNGAPPGESAVLDAGVVRDLALQNGLQWDNPGAILRIVVPRGVGGPHMVETLTYARSLSTGEVIQPEDLTFGKVAGFSIPADAPRDAEQIIGKIARRPLRSGAAVATHDVTNPQVIKVNDTVQVIYRADGVNLVLEAKALSSAAVGDAVEVINPVSKKTIEAIASGADEAVVGPEAEAIRARPSALSSEFAALR